MSSEPFLEARRLWFSYPERAALIKDLSLNLDRSRLTLLSGENGCGKSTLLKLLAGDLKPGGGEILWRDQPLPNDKTMFFRQIWHMEQESARQRVGICPRHDLEIWDMAFEQACRKGATNHKSDSISWSDAAARFNLEPAMLDLPYHQLSTGESRATVLMPLLRTKSHYWLLDEPMSGLDSARATSFLQVCAEKLSEGVGMLIVTHTPEAYNDLPHIHLELRDGILWELE